MKNIEQQLQFKHSKHLISFLSKWLPHVSKRERTIINVMIGYASHWNPEKNLMFPSQLRIANKADCTTKTVERAVKTLKDSRVFTVIKRQRKTSLIGFNFPALLSFLKMSVQKCLSNKFSLENYIFKQVNSIEHEIFNSEKHIEKRIKQAAKTAFNIGQSAMRKIFNDWLGKKKAEREQKNAPQKSKRDIANKILAAAEKERETLRPEHREVIEQALADAGYSEGEAAFQSWMKLLALVDAKGQHHQHQ